MIEERFFPDLNFRLSLVRNALLVDTVPTFESVTKYSEHLLAELEQLGQHAKRKESADVQPKLKSWRRATTTTTSSRDQRESHRRSLSQRRSHAGFFCLKVDASEEEPAHMDIFWMEKGAVVGLVAVVSTWPPTATLVRKSNLELPRSSPR